MKISRNTDSHHRTYSKLYRDLPIKRSIMYSLNHWPRFNPLNYLLYKPEDRPVHSRNKARATKTISQPFRALEKIDIQKNRYQVLPYRYEEEAASRLYCLLRRCRSVTDFLKDQVVHLSNTLRKLCQKESDALRFKRQMVDKQLSFLKILMARVNSDLGEYNSNLKDAIENKRLINGYALKEEGERIEAELSNFYDATAFAKKTLYNLFRRCSYP